MVTEEKMFPTIPWSEIASSIQRGTIAEIKEILKDPWKLQTSARAEWIIIVLRPNLERLLPEGIEAWLWWIGDQGSKPVVGPLGDRLFTIIHCGASLCHARTERFKQGEALCGSYRTWM